MLEVCSLLFILFYFKRITIKRLLWILEETLGFPTVFSLPINYHPGLLACTVHLWQELAMTPSFPISLDLHICPVPRLTWDCFSTPTCPQCCLLAYDVTCFPHLLIFFHVGWVSAFSSSPVPQCRLLHRPFLYCTYLNYNFTFLMSPCESDVFLSSQTEGTFVCHSFKCPRQCQKTPCDACMSREWWMDMWSFRML